MTPIELTRIAQNPKFLELASKRNRFGWTLAVIMFVVYMSFIGLVALDHAFVAQVTGPGPITMAFPLGLGVIVVAIALTGVYVVRANSEFDRLTREIVGLPPVLAPAPFGAKLAGTVR